MNTTSHRPYNLPAELPDPPTPPAGHRGVYRKPGHYYANSAAIFRFNHKELEWSYDRALIESFPDCHTVEIIPLRKAPEGVADVPEGLEYHDSAKSGYVAISDFAYGDVALHFPGGWQNVSGYTYGSWPTAYRIGSEIHHRHFDAVAESPVTDDLDTTDVIAKPEPATPFPWPLNPAKPQPAKAREWDMSVTKDGELAAPFIEYTRTNIKVREIHPDETSLLAEAVGLGYQAAGQLRDILIDMPIDKYPGARQFLKDRFPAPAPEPAFDMDKLWESVPAWHPYLTHDENRDCHTHSELPQCILSLRDMAGYWEGIGDKLRIPREIAPPAPFNWMVSLVQRPTPTSKQP